MKRNLWLGFGFRPVYVEGEGGDGGEPTPEQKAAADKAAADKAAADKAAADANDPMKKLQFTPEQQEFFSRKMAEEKRNWQNQNQKTIEELKKLQTQQGTSEKQRAELQEQIETLRRQHMSKEELAKEDQARKEREFQQSLESHKGEAVKWKTLYQESTITRALQDAAIAAEAFNPNQIVDMLYQKTKLVDELDENNQPTGRLIPRVQFTDSDEKDGKLVTLDLTVKEVMLKLKNTPEKWGNLFKSTLAGGLGANGSVNGGRRTGKRAQDMTAAEWAEARKKDPSLSFADKATQ